MFDLYLRNINLKIITTWYNTESNVANQNDTDK